MRTGRMSELKQRMLLRSHAPLFAFVLAMAMSLLALLPVGPASRLIPAAWAHALPVRSEPAANAALRTPPAQVHIWFDDALVSGTSHIIVQDSEGHHAADSRRVRRNFLYPQA